MGIKVYLIRIVSHAQLERVLTVVRIHNARVDRACAIDDLYRGVIPDGQVVVRDHPEMMRVGPGMFDSTLIAPGQIAEWACDDWILTLQQIIVNKTQVYLLFTTSAFCEPAHVAFNEFKRDFITETPRWKQNGEGIDMIIAEPEPGQDQFEPVPTFREMTQWVTDVMHTADATQLVSFAANGDRATRAARDYIAGRNAREEARLRTNLAKRMAKKAAALGGVAIPREESEAPQP